MQCTAWWLSLREPCCISYESGSQKFSSSGSQKFSSHGEKIAGEGRDDYVWWSSAVYTNIESLCCTLKTNGICLLYLNLKLNLKGFEKVLQFSQKTNAIIVMRFALPWVPLLKADGYNYRQAAGERTLLGVGRAAEIMAPYPCFSQSPPTS